MRKPGSRQRVKSAGHRLRRKNANAAKKPRGGVATRHKKRRAFATKTTTGRKSPTRRTPRSGKIRVRRSSGRIEAFNPAQLTRIASRSGIPYLMARDIAKTISREIAANRRRAQGNRRNIVIDVKKLRERVAQELKKRNRSDIASSYLGEVPENSRQSRFSLANENEPILDKVAANRSRLLFDKSSPSARSTKSAITRR